MADEIFLVDIDAINEYSEEFNQFFAEFVQTHTTALVSSLSSESIPATLLKHSKYVFSANGHEFYSYGKLLYKNVTQFSEETNRWVSSLKLKTDRALDHIFVYCDPYTAAQLCIDYNLLATDYVAISCKNGFKLRLPDNPRTAINTLIPSQYRIKFLAPISSFGGDNYKLATAIGSRGTFFNADNESHLRELLLYLSEK